MKPATIFGLVVRLVGVFLLYKAVMALTGYVAMVDFSGSVRPVTRPVFLHFILLAAAAAWFLYGAPPIQEWAYPDLTREKGRDSTETPKAQGPFCVSCGKPIPAGSKNCPACGWTQPI